MTPDLQSSILNLPSSLEWRLLIHPAAPGAENMAVDEAIAQAIAAQLVPPTLRFYAWAPPCVSLGRNQPVAGVDLARRAALGYDVVRRPTGGRAILHTDEMTYSIVAAPDHPLMHGYVLDSYLRISHGLVAGLRRLGIDAEEAPGTNRAGPDVSAACFEVPSAYEIVASGRKVLGSAQARRSTSVLQHGSLPLVGDLTRVVDCLAFDDEAEREALRASLKGHAATLEELLGRVVTYDEAVDALAAGMVEALGIELRRGELTDQERAWTAQLMAEKYQHDSWTMRA
ncbi:MAG: lipoate--protein ligase family protein [Anaerolineae bacterium]|nr:lipoate--protein ligase family protein [Anaerolineae bacterium]